MILNLTDIFIANPQILFDEKRLRALFSDFYNNTLLKVNLCMNVYNSGFLDEVRNNFPVTDRLRAQYITKLTEDNGIEQRNATEAVDTWISFLTEEVINEANKFESQNSVSKVVSKEITAIKEHQKNTAKNGAIKRDDSLSIYINPVLPNNANGIYIPCGIGKTDLGFFIHGISREYVCKHSASSIYALVYNFLLRNTVIDTKSCKRYLKHCGKTSASAEFRDVYRFAVIILQLIRNNKKLEVNISLEDRDNFKYAIKLIDYYAELFSCLAKRQYTPLRVITNTTNGTRISLVNTKDKNAIYITNNTTIKSVAREIWYAGKILYEIDELSKSPLESILEEISPYDTFHKGQFEALRDMLNNEDNSVCIMPTGSGKSLIYYIASLLQPLPIFVISPTEILIDDQIRNLKNIHKIDNVAHLLLYDDNDFSTFKITNNLVYLTPETFQNENLKKFYRHVNNGTLGAEERQIAPGTLVAYIVLDEIHCVSNLGHDFRPEYLMLSKLLSDFLSNVTVWGFTATANYSVVKDIQNQLNIRDNNFVSPVSVERPTINYHYRSFKSEDELLERTAFLAKEFVRSHQKTIIFTKNDDISRSIREAIGGDVTIFSNKDLTAYYDFVNGNITVLIANEELGIGINLPGVDNIIHYGLPFSKSDYIQQIGRAGRLGGVINSYVLFLKAQGNIPKELLLRNTHTTQIPVLLKDVNNDYYHIFRHLANDCVEVGELKDNLNELCYSLDYRKQSLYVATYEIACVNRIKRLLYVLYTVGYIKDWAVYKSTNETLTFRIDINSSVKMNGDSGSLQLSEAELFERMKQTSRAYFEFIGKNYQLIGDVKKEITALGKAETYKEIIEVYVNWYYEKYLYQHNEQFLELYEFITNSIGKSNKDISTEIKDYFTLPFVKIKHDENYYSEIGLEDALQSVRDGISNATIANINRINADNYSIKLDWTLFCYTLIYKNKFDSGRFDRLCGAANNEEKIQIVNLLHKLYVLSDLAGRLAIIKYISEKNTIDLQYLEFLDTIYVTETKDAIYYGLLSERLNTHFSLLGVADAC